MNEVMNRPMFAGSVQPTPDSVGVGITSGLVPDQSAEQAFAQVSGSMENMLSEIDSAKDTEGIINAMRGNDASIEERYNELAGYVGEKDAKQTPESVLTLVQPTFSMVDTLKQSAPAGGIADANIGEASPMSSPGMDEAVNRMMQGEQPVFRQAGSPLTGENIFTNPMDIFSLKNIPAPNLETIDRDKIKRDADFYLDQMRPYFETFQTQADAITPEARLEKLKPYLPTVKTADQFMKEYSTLLGDSDKKSQQAQAYLTLAKAGADIASSPKGLVGAVAESVGKATPELMSMLQTEQETNKRIKLAAIEAERNQNKNLENMIMQVANTAISDKNAAVTQLGQIQLDAVKDAINKGIDINQADTKTINDEIILRYNSMQKYATNGTTTYINPSDGTLIEGRLRPSDNTIVYLNADSGEYEPLPPGFVTYQKGMLKELGLSKEKDWKTKDISIPYSTVVTGTRKIGGEDVEMPMTLLEYLQSKNPNFKPNLNGYEVVPAFVSGTEIRMSLSGDPNDTVLAPPGFKYGKVDNLEAVVDDNGDVKIVDKAKGTARYTSIKDEDGQDIRVGLTDEFLENQIPTFNKETGALISGNPTVYAKNMITSDLFRQLSTGEKAKFARRMAHSLESIDFINEFMNLIPEATGPEAFLKGFSNSVAAPFVDEDSLLRFPRTEIGEDYMKRFKKHLQRTEGLSDRFAFKEQEQITRDLAEEPSKFFRDPTLAMEKMKNFKRILLNRVYQINAYMNNDQQYYFQERLPMGTRNDPLDYGTKGHLEAYAITSKYIKEKYKDDPEMVRDKLSKLHIRISPYTANKFSKNTKQNIPAGVYNAINFGANIGD